MINSFRHIVQLGGCVLCTISKISSISYPFQCLLGPLAQKYMEQKYLLCQKLWHLGNSHMFKSTNASV